MSTAQGERRLRLAASRSLLYSLPANELFELPGRPHVVYQLRTYSNTINAEEAAQQARNDSPFLFKAFETGQIGPKRLARIHGDKPRVATIHEYLDWTVTAQAAEGDDELDFGGFRVLLILPRYRSGWPPPGGDAPNAEVPRPHSLGAPRSPMPALQTHGKPVTAATIRSGPGYLEVPFVATHENKRGRGYCRCLVEAVEDIARALGLKKLMLCSTNDSAVQSTWQHLGFEYASDERMEEWDILHTDLVYLQNTTQMHKNVPPRRRFKPVIIRHDVFRQRTYAFVGQKRPQRPTGGAPGVSKRQSSRRSVSSIKEDSQLLAAREQAVAAGAFAKGNVARSATPYSSSSPAAASALGGTPRAASSAVGRLFAEEHAQEPLQHEVPGGPQLRDEGIAAGGPPTPPPADGGALRPLHAHASSAHASTSGQRSRLATTGLERQDLSHCSGLPQGDMAGPGLALSAGAPGLGDSVATLGLSGNPMPYQGAWLAAPTGMLGLDSSAMQMPVPSQAMYLGPQSGVEPLGSMGMYSFPQAGQPYGSYAGVPLEAQGGHSLCALYPGSSGHGPALRLNTGRLLDGSALQQAGVSYPGLTGVHPSLQLGLQPVAHVGLTVGSSGAQPGGMADGRLAQIAPQPVFGGLGLQGHAFGFNPSQPPPPLLPDGAG